MINIHYVALSGAAIMRDVICGADQHAPVFDTFDILVNSGMK